MKIRNTGEPVSIPALGLDVEAGAEFDAPDELAAELLTRPGFATKTKAVAAKATTKTKATAAAPSEED